MGSSPREAVERCYKDYVECGGSMVVMIEIFQSPNGNIMERVLGFFSAHANTGTIGSLWGPLDMRDSIEILKQTPQWVKFLMEDVYAYKLHNHVSATNEMALKWIEKSGVFKLDRRVSEVFSGNPYYYFETIPLEEFPQDV